MNKTKMLVILAGLMRAVKRPARVAVVAGARKREHYSALRQSLSTARGTPVSRLTIDMTDQQHQSLKALAALQGKTIKQYALERLFPGDTDADQAWQELKNLLGDRIKAGLSGKVSDKSIDQILDEELAESGRA